jgi:hypothetical protein
MAAFLRYTPVLALWMMLRMKVEAAARITYLD